MRGQALQLGLLLLTCASCAFDGEDCTTTRSQQTYSAREEWMHLKDVVFHKGVIHYKAALSWHLEYVTGRRLLESPGFPLDLGITYEATDQPCKCNIVEKRPTSVISVYNLGHYGHTMFDGVSALYAMLRETNVKVDKTSDHVVYMGFDSGSLVAQADQGTDEEGNLDLGIYGEIFGAFVKNRPLSLKFLLQQSEDKVYCFQDLTLGLSSTIGHYNAGYGYWNKQLMKDFANDLRLNLGVQPFFDLECKYRATIVHRLQSRRITNVHELAKVVQRVLQEKQVPSHCVDIVSLEEMSIPHQIELMHNTRLLIGVDGSGLLNAAFMQGPCSGCIHLKPYRQDIVEPGKHGEYLNFCTNIAGHWFSWDNKDPTSVSFPLHHDHARYGHLFSKVLNSTEDVLKAELPALQETYQMTRMQDMTVNLTEIETHVLKAVDATKDVECEAEVVRKDLRHRQLRRA